MYIKVRVKAGQRTEKVIQDTDDYFVISVKEKAKDNMANSRVLEIIRNKYPGKTVRIISGHHSPGKLLAIDE